MSECTTTLPLLDVTLKSSKSSQARVRVRVAKNFNPLKKIENGRALADRGKRVGNPSLDFDALLFVNRSETDTVEGGVLFPEVARAGASLRVRRALHVRYRCGAQQWLIRAQPPFLNPGWDGC